MQEKMEKIVKSLMKKEEGLRFNEGKLRYDLVHPVAHEGLVDVLTYGSTKYSERNWEKGMAWSKVLSSLKRHLAAIEKGEDFDKETKKLHADHLQCNAHFLSAYYKIYPQGDDRPHNYMKRPRIGLDIDEVLADFTSGWAKIHSLDERPECWNYHRDMASELKKMRDSGTLDEFYLSLQPKTLPSEIPFEPHCYVTSRPVDTLVTEKWLEIHKFPGSKVITVPIGESKVEALREAGVDMFVDDAFHNFVELNNAGICTFLFDAPHNQRYEVGFKRIKSLRELV